MKYKNISYQVIRSRRKTLAIQIMPDGTVAVRCPARMADADIHSFVAEKAGWIEKNLAKLRPAASLPRFTNTEIRALAQKALKIIPERVACFAPIVGVSCGNITIRSQRSRWGSCSGLGNLNFNCLLMLVPTDVMDYVVVHELCHRKEMNHSAKFWAEVERVLPDYMLRRQWLKDNGGALISRL